MPFFFAVVLVGAAYLVDPTHATTGFSYQTDGYALDDTACAGAKLAGESAVVTNVTMLKDGKSYCQLLPSGEWIKTIVACGTPTVEKTYNCTTDASCKTCPVKMGENTMATGEVQEDFRGGRCFQATWKPASSGAAKVTARYKCATPETCTLLPSCAAKKDPKEVVSVAAPMAVRGIMVAVLLPLAAAIALALAC